MGGDTAPIAAIAGRVSGKVQGVWFRRETQKVACQLGLQGWVRNEDDGSVTFYAVGDRASLDSLCQWLRMGPRLARVDALHVVAVTAEQSTLAGDKGFVIRR
jgi:acylphosphatase